MNGKRSGVLEMSGEGSAARERLRSKRRLGFNSSSAPIASWAQAIMQRAATDLAMALRTAVLPFFPEAGWQCYAQRCFFRIEKVTLPAIFHGVAGGESSRRREGFEERDDVLDLGLVELGVKAHHVAQRREAAVVHVGRGACHVAQPRDAELAEVALLRLDVARAGGGGAPRVVVIATEQVVRARLQPLDAAVAPGIDAPRRDE